MDLENFDAVDDISPLSPRTISRAADALEEVDRKWYTPAARRARWMDLLGDYAGSEPFVIDGDSLLQIVLDDPLLAIGRPHDPSFQILHAYQILERTLLEFTQRSANIEIVFWQANCHATIQTGGPLFTVASRAFARTLLFKHLLRLDIPVHVFEDLDDPSWARYEANKKPMFVMANYGGLPTRKASFGAERILIQRVFIFELLSHGIAVTLFKGAEYRDSKILSFVHEQKRDTAARKLFAEEIWVVLGNARNSLDAELRRQSNTKGLQLSVDRTPAVEDNSGILELAQHLSKKISSDVPGELLYIFVMHCILLRGMSVRERARPLEPLGPALADTVTNHFLPPIFFKAASIFRPSDRSIDVDGRTFVSLIRFLLSRSSKDISTLVGASTFSATQDIWSKIGSPALDLSSLAARYPPSALPPLPTADPVVPFRLLPFDNDVFNEQLSLVNIPVEESDDDDDDDSPPAHLDFGQGTLFSDTQHWHNQKSILPNHLGGTKPKPVDERSRRRELRSNQRFMATLQTQAATLTGASGAILQQIVIPPVGSQGSKSSHKARPAAREQGAASKKVKAIKLSSADKLRQKIQEEKNTVQEDSSQSWWRGQLSSMSAMTLTQKMAHIISLQRNKKSEERYMGLEIRLYRLNLQALLWIDDSDNDSPPVRDKYTVSMMRTIKEICDRGAMTPTVAKVISSTLHALGFQDYVDGFLAPLESDMMSDRPLGFEFKKLIKSKSKTPYYKFMAITEHPTVWQLRLFGEFMDRSMDSAPDRRVAFDPDAWQRKVLDCVDDGQSLLVVAPTSAGKTFISFYAMERVLRNSDDGILVYVAPTKALVTQIAAEVYARFSKNLNGKSCWAIHTRDYRVHDPQKCQILVTVPEMLAIMLLSPPLARVWTPRIKRIILDEIHSIGQEEGGAVWEQIILLAPCPIIGLSATIGSADIFNNWLQSVQEAHGYKHTFIQHPHRYSHLRKFHYDLSGNNPPKPFQGLDSYRPTQRARFLHPIAMLSFGARSLPPDLALEAQDTLSLYRALVPFKDSLKHGLQALEPTTFFASTSTLLRQKDIVRYEDALKDALSPLLASFDPQDTTSLLHGVIRKLEDPVILGLSAEALNTAPSRTTFRENLIFLVADLHAKGELPAILFNFDRGDCEIMAKDLLSALGAAETRWRSTSTEWQRKLHDWETWKLRAKERERLADKAKKQKKDPDAADSGGNQDYSWESSFNPEDPSPQFSWAGTHTSYSKADLDEDIYGLARWSHVEPWILRALRRGIAVHHAGMNKRYRSLVESLFRQGFVRVVIATGTLALGINAPTKTSVFCGDSPYLTALMYRQCAGRAGRRGYDLLGNVVFYGLPMDRVQRLVLSKLPSLGGNFPLTSTLTLRLLNLLEGSEYASVAVDAIKSIMSLPHISFSSNAGRHQLLHHLRFSIEYLRRSRLLDSQGKPMNLFAVAAHLYYTEPSNLALVALLRNGVLHKICAQHSAISAQEDYITLMSHLFGRRYLPRIYTTSKNLSGLIKKYPSMVVLPRLSATARNVLVEHDREILRVFTGYALAYTSEYATQLGPDSQLPLSKIEYSGASEAGPISPFRKHLSATAIPVVARSPFVANSGHSDKFGSVEELTRTVRQGFHLNGHAIPSLGHLTADEGSEHAVNAYLLDFYKHGQVESLARANGIRKGDLWYLLQDFTLTLTTVKAALEQLLLKVSKEATAAQEDHEDEDITDSGYASFNPAEMDQDDDKDAHSDFKRPDGVTDADWRVYEIVRGAMVEFDTKYRAMWA